jgi:hypothetical protein
VLSGRLPQARPNGGPLHQKQHCVGIVRGGQSVGKLAKSQQLIGEFTGKRHGGKNLSLIRRRKHRTQCKPPRLRIQCEKQGMDAQTSDIGELSRAATGHWPARREISTTPFEDSGRVAPYHPSGDA